MFMCNFIKLGSLPSGGAGVFCQWDIIWGGVAGLSQSTAAMSLRCFQKRGENKTCIENNTSRPYVEKRNLTTKYFNSYTKDFKQTGIIA